MVEGEGDVEGWAGIPLYQKAFDNQHSALHTRLEFGLYSIWNLC